MIVPTGPRPRSPLWQRTMMVLARAGSPSHKRKKHGSAFILVCRGLYKNSGAYNFGLFNNMLQYRILQTVGGHSSGSKARPSMATRDAKGPSQSTIQSELNDLVRAAREPRKQRKYEG